MGWSKANLWNSRQSRIIAREIAGLGLYCGPAVVAWIAAVWNLDKGRTYDYVGRLKDKDLFPDGPRRFSGDGFWGQPEASNPPPGFESSLNAILRRETNDELKLTSKTYYKYGTIHGTLERFDMPVIIRMYPNLVGLHYVSLYKSRKWNHRWAFDRIKFYWQDNSIFGKRNGGNPGLYGTGRRRVGWSIFLYGAKRVEKV